MTDYYSGLFASTLDQQFLFFSKALLFGFALAALYDILRIYRTAFKCRKTVLLIQDIIFSVIAAFLTFLFAFVLNNGKVRIYLIISHFLGALLYRLSLSKIVMGVSTVIIKIIKKVLKFISQKVFSPVFRLFKKIIELLKFKLKSFFSVIFKNFKRKNKKIPEIKSDISV